MRLSLLLLAFVFFPSDADAQRRGQALAREGDLALSIGLGSLSDLALRPLDGGVGLRYRVADRTVFGASVGLSFTEQEVERGFEGDRSDEEETDVLETSLSLWAERHIGGSRVVSPFVGLGGRVSLYRFDSASELTGPCLDLAPCPEPTRRSRDYDRRTASAGVMLGAEVKLARGVTLGGAYTLGAEYSEIEETYIIDGPDVSQDQTREQSGWRYGVGTTQVGLSIYF